MPNSKDRDVELAERRAKISSHLENNPGEHSPSMIAAALGLHPTGVGLMLAQMANSGLINKPRMEDTKKLYHWGKPEKNGLNGAGTAPKRAYIKKDKTTTAAASTLKPDQFGYRTYVRLEGAEMSFPVDASPNQIGATIAATLMALRSSKKS